MSMTPPVPAFVPNCCAAAVQRNVHAAGVRGADAARSACREESRAQASHGFECIAAADARIRQF